MYRDYLGCVQRLLPRDRSTLGPTRRLTGFVPYPIVEDETRSSRGLRDRVLTDASLFRCAPLSDREAAAARVPPLRPDVLVGVEPAETPKDGLRHGHLRDALLLPVLPLQIEDRGELSQAPALGAQHQVDVALGRRTPGLSRRTTPSIFP